MRTGFDPPSQSASLGLPHGCLLWGVKLAEETQLAETLVSQMPSQKTAGRGDPTGQSFSLQSAVQVNQSDANLEKLPFS